MNKKEAWQRIPSLVRRYGPFAARAVCDVVGTVRDDALMDLIIQADACALYGEPLEAARLYVRASQVVKNDMCLRHTSSLLESAIECDSSHIQTRMQLIQALHTGCSFWRAGEHLQCLTDFDCSSIALSRWLEFFAQLSIEPRMQAGLLRCYVWLMQQFTRDADQQQILETILGLVRSAESVWARCWNEYITMHMHGKHSEKAMLLGLILK